MMQYLPLALFLQVPVLYDAYVLSSGLIFLFKFLFGIVSTHNNAHESRWKRIWPGI